MKFSVLMSIYHKEKVEYFDRAMQSIYEEQSLQPDEIILVKDGPLNEELYSVINKWKKKLGATFKTIPLESNVGLGDALNIGLHHCTNELVARMDTDDIASQDRFEKQLKVFKENDIDICSSWVSEFDNNEDEIVSHRKLPEFHSEIISFGKKRCPINHPAVMYKKNSVLKAGGYKKMMWFEDYYLWSRMILNDAKFYNIQEPLVKMRAGYGQLERRSGFKYAKSELTLQKRFKYMGYINNFEYFRNVQIRFVTRILPKSIVKRVYKRLRS